MTIVCVFTPKIVALRSTPTITIDLPWWLVLQKGWAVAWISWLDRGRSGGATALRRLDVQQLALIGVAAAIVAWEAYSVECKAWRPDWMHREVKRFSVRDPVVLVPLEGVNTCK